MKSLHPKLLIALVVFALGLVLGAGMAPAQHSPCNPEVQTCL